MNNNLNFQVRFVAAGTGSGVWDDPHADHVIQRFMPVGRHHGPMIGIVHLGSVKPSPSVLRDVVVTIGEDVKAGRYGDFTLFVASEDADTRQVLGDIATAQDVAVFVSQSWEDLAKAEPVGSLTARDRETMNFVMSVGGTVTAAQFAKDFRMEHTTAGNRLVTLHKKGYLQRIERPHPIGDLFVDPRSITLGSAQQGTSR